MPGIPSRILTPNGDFSIHRIPSLSYFGQQLGYKIERAKRRVIINASLCVEAQQNALKLAKNRLEEPRAARFLGSVD